MPDRDRQLLGDEAVCALVRMGVDRVDPQSHARVALQYGQEVKPRNARVPAECSQCLVYSPKRIATSQVDEHRPHGNQEVTASLAQPAVHLLDLGLGVPPALVIRPAI